MTDLSGLTLTLDRPTTTAPALIAWNAKKAAERAANDERKAAQARYFRELERAAIESQTRPIKAAPKPPKPKGAVERTPREPKGRTYSLKVIPCKNCGQMTRAANVTADRAPNTVTRRGGLCPDCAPPRRSTRSTERLDQFRPCAGTCGRMTRPGHMRLSEAPRTVPRKRHGKCSSCFTSGPPRRATPASIRLCAGGCGRLTKPRYTAHETPGVVPRVRDGKCSTCLTGGRVYVSKVVDSAGIAADYAAGMSLRELRVKYGVAKDTVSRHVKAAGVPMRPAPTNFTRKQAVK